MSISDFSEPLAAKKQQRKLKTTLSYFEIFPSLVMNLDRIIYDLLHKLYVYPSVYIKTVFEVIVIYKLIIYLIPIPKFLGK